MDTMTQVTSYQSVTIQPMRHTELTNAPQVRLAATARAVDRTESYRPDQRTQIGPVAPAGPARACCVCVGAMQAILIQTTLHRSAPCASETARCGRWR